MKNYLNRASRIYWGNDWRVDENHATKKSYKDPIAKKKRRRVLKEEGKEHRRYREDES